MIRDILSTFADITALQILDILVMAFIIYQALKLIRGTRGWQMTVGVTALILFYYVSRGLDLDTVRLFLETAVPYFIFALLVAFQAEIRRALVEIGRGKLFSGLRRGESASRLQEIVLAATTLASGRIGALVVIERQIGLRNYIEAGIRLDAYLTYDLLLTIFNPKGPLHDGAVIISENRIAAAACFLPLTTDPYLSKELGTRHRAAIGITEETDALVVVVSEETGTISAVRGGEITRNLDGPRLLRILEQQLGHEEEDKPEVSEGPPLAESAETRARSESV